jgi:hypothetical protein
MYIPTYLLIFKGLIFFPSLIPGVKLMSQTVIS